MKLLDRFKPKEAVGRTSYSQCGEDLIVDFIFAGRLGISNPSYLDLGAHHPTYLSNTYFFYLKGSQGVCVEADPTLIAIIAKERKRDTCLNVGVGTKEGVGDFYVMSARTLNTFSKEEAERYQGYGTHRIEEVIQVPLLPVNTIIERSFSSAPDFISLDVEGLDFAILESFDFSRFRPSVFCVETITYTEDNSERKLKEIGELMNQKGYMVFADTYVNTIFVEAEDWKAGKAHRSSVS